MSPDPDVRSQRDPTRSVSLRGVVPRVEWLNRSMVPLARMASRTASSGDLSPELSAIYLRNL